MPIDGLLEPALFKALSDQTRTNILACIAKCGRGCSVTEIAGCCTVDLSVVSRHLAVLERAGLLDSVRDGRTVYYQVRYNFLARRLREIAAALDSCCR